MTNEEFRRAVNAIKATGMKQIEIADYVDLSAESITRMKKDAPIARRTEIAIQALLRERGINTI